MVDESGNAKRIYCRRPRFHPAGGKPGNDGGVSFPLNEAITLQRPAPARRTVPTVERASVEHIDAIYTMLLRKHLTLSDEHRRKLLARGLSEREIADQAYASTPTREHGDLIAREMGELGLAGVPGFWRDGGEWRCKRMPPGFFIPVRNEHSQITGLQVRCDDPTRGKYLWFSSAGYSSGTGSGAPVHFAKPHLLWTLSEIIVTEGSLKANIIAHFTGSPVVAAAGVGNFGADFASHLWSLCPHVTPIIALDMDWMVKPQVEAALQKIKRELRTVGFNVKTRTWPSRFKGLDDYLLAYHNSSSSRMEVAA